MTKQIWITRTEPGANRLATKLLELGYKPLVAPVYEIIPVLSSTPHLKTDLWVFVSTHAVSHAANRPWDKTKPTIAVGPSTAAELELFGISPLVPVQHSSEGIYDLIRSRFTRGIQVTIVAGRDGRKHLAQWLELDQYSCNVWIVYERKATDVQIGNTPLDAILVGSTVALSNVRQQFTSKKSVSIPLVVPSPRYVELAKSMQFNDVRVAKGSSDTAIIAALNALFSTK